MMKPIDQRIYLASKSPRRRELLRQIGVDFELMLLRSAPPRGEDVDESVYAGESAVEYVRRVTEHKAAFASQSVEWRRLPVRPVLAADTCVVIDGQILGKPADAADAREMLTQLSGRTHQVYTSVAVQHQHKLWQTTQLSEVRFANLSEADIAAYCASSEPYDKAGGYAIQGLAAMFIEHISGSHSGIMGLPLFETVQLLRQVGIKLP